MRANLERTHQAAVVGRHLGDDRRFAWRGPDWLRWVHLHDASPETAIERAERRVAETRALLEGLGDTVSGLIGAEVDVALNAGGVLSLLRRELREALDALEVERGRAESPG